MNPTASIVRQSCCCGGVNEKAAHTRRAGRTLGEAAGWVASSTLLILMPKCPACIAAYIAASTGLGVSVSSAGYARIALIAMGITSIMLLAMRRIRNVRRRRRATDVQPSG